MLPEIEAVIKGFEAAKHTIKSVTAKNAQVKAMLNQMERDLIAWNTANNKLMPAPGSRRDILFNMNDDGDNNRVSIAADDVSLLWPPNQH